MLRDGKGNIISYTVYKGTDEDESNVEFEGRHISEVLTVVDPWCSITPFKPYHYAEIDLVCTHPDREYVNEKLLLTTPPMNKWICKDCGDSGFGYIELPKTY
jgi:hypothetical protein